MGKGKSTGSRSKALGNLRPKPWKPGQSGNPAGISKARAEFRRIFENIMQEKVKDKTSGKYMMIIEMAIRKLAEAALIKDERWAIEFICDKVAPKTLIVENEGNAPTGTPIIDFEKVFEGLKLDKKTLDKMRERYLAQVFPDRGFSKEEES